MENKAIIVVSSAFAVVVSLAMYMFISQQKNNNMVKEANDLKLLMEKMELENKENIDALKSTIDSMTHRLDETDLKYHTQN
jgi:hypothetical protein